MATFGDKVRAYCKVRKNILGRMTARLHEESYGSFQVNREKEVSFASDSIRKKEEKEDLKYEGMRIKPLEKFFGMVRAL